MHNEAYAYVYRVTRLLVLLALLRPLNAAAGYHYDRPSAPAAPIAIGSSAYGGHHFGALPTLRPLPPVPQLPPLPTPRPPIPRSRPQLQSSILTRYLPPPAAPVAQVSYHGVTAGQPVYSAPALRLQGAPQQQYMGFTAPSGPSGPSGPAGLVLQQATAQPLRVPFGKTALFSPGESYLYNGRQLKQYAVIELIDNDLLQSPQPFLRSDFIDQYRASNEANRAGVPAMPAIGGGVQIGSRANTNVLQQQQLSTMPRPQQTQPQGDAVALGSGGLGFIRLPNGNVYLGSGSLGYISGQQRMASVLDLRTRGETTQDALHFGHGSLGGVSNFLGF